MTAPYAPGKGLNPFTVSIPPDVSPMPVIAGYGSPETVVSANPGTGYQELVSDDFYVKFGGVGPLGWRKVGKVPVTSTVTDSTAPVAVFTGDGSPVGVVTPAADAAIYIQQDSTPPGTMWSWYDDAWH